MVENENPIQNQKTDIEPGKPPKKVEFEWYVYVLAFGFFFLGLIYGGIFQGIFNMILVLGIIYIVKWVILKTNN